LARAVTERAPGAPLLPPLRAEVHALVRHCTAEDAAPVWGMIDASPALRKYEESMRVRHAERLAAAITADPELSRTPTASRALAQFVLDAYALAREAADPEGAVDEVFGMIEAAWKVTASRDS
ncbi:TetR/AcrR family transcriptional regulator, partial [Streptomyces sp. SID11233]|nr:TetR/AcrR family transcriptional regulator [Streptomyces sp. SID11233]